MKQQPESLEISPVKRALSALKEMQARVTRLENEKHQPIAIIGMGCRFPGGVTDPQSYWLKLREGFNPITDVPANRWDTMAFFDPHPQTPGKMNQKAGCFLENVEEFDAEFFGVSPREASSMDPQQRILLEVAWEAVENSGLDHGNLTGGNVGVYIGIMGLDYMQMTLRQLEYTEVNP